MSEKEIYPISKDKMYPFLRDLEELFRKHNLETITPLASKVVIGFKEEKFVNTFCDFKFKDE